MPISFPMRVSKEPEKQPMAVGQTQAGGSLRAGLTARSRHGLAVNRIRSTVTSSLRSATGRREQQHSNSGVSSFLRAASASERSARTAVAGLPTYRRYEP
jgi:hypothetical protein